MTRSNPLSLDALIAYWAGDLPDAEVDRVEEHLMGCEHCSTQSARMAALREGVRGLIPPVVTRALVEEWRASGLRVAENSFLPGERRGVVFDSTLDLLIHRLGGFDLSNVERLRVVVRVESSGDVLFDHPDAPFDPEDGVLIACQRHYANMPPDVEFELVARDGTGGERRALYQIPHAFAK